MAGNDKLAENQKIDKILHLDPDEIETAKFEAWLKEEKDIKLYFDKYGNQVKIVPVRELLRDLINARDIINARLFEKSGLHKTGGYDYTNGKRTISRDKVIQFSFGLELTRKQTDRFLLLAGMSTLYPKFKRDAVVIHALLSGMKINDLQDKLNELSLPMLGEHDDKDK